MSRKKPYVNYITPVIALVNSRVINAPRDRSKEFYWSLEVPQDVVKSTTITWQRILNENCEILTFHLRKNKFLHGGSLGFSVKGTVEEFEDESTENSPPLKRCIQHHSILHIKQGTAASYSKLKPGDELLEINGIKLYNTSSDKLIETIRRAPNHVRLVCARRSSQGSTIEDSSAICPSRSSTIDRNHRYSSPSRISMSSGMRSRDLQFELAEVSSTLSSNVTSLGHASDQQLYEATFETIEQRATKASLMNYLRDVAQWSSSPILFELRKGRFGLEFSIIPYEDPMDKYKRKVIVYSIRPGGVTDIDGRISPGDWLSFVNDRSLENVTISQALDVIKAPRVGSRVILGIKKPLDFHTAPPSDLDNMENGSSRVLTLWKTEEPTDAEKETREKRHSICSTISAPSTASTVQPQEFSKVPAVPETEENFLEIERRKEAGLGITLEPLGDGRHGYRVMNIADDGDVAVDNRLSEGDVITQLMDQNLRTPAHEDVDSLLQSIAHSIPEGDRVRIKYVPAGAMGNHIKQWTEKEKDIEQSYLEESNSPQCHTTRITEIHDVDPSDNKEGESHGTTSTVTRQFHTLQRTSSSQDRSSSTLTTRVDLHPAPSFSECKSVTQFNANSPPFPTSFQPSGGRSESYDILQNPKSPDSYLQSTVRTYSSVEVLSRSLTNNKKPIRAVTLHRESPSTALGITILGRVDEEGVRTPEDSVDHSLDQCQGVFIKGVTENSPAHRAGVLKPGDRILQVNNVDLSNATHDEAVSVMKHAQSPVMLVVQPSIEEFKENNVPSEVAQRNQPLLIPPSLPSDVVYATVSRKKKRSQSERKDTNKSQPEDDSSDSEDQYGYTKKGLRKRYSDLDGQVLLFRLKYPETGDQRPLGIRVTEAGSQMNDGIFVSAISADSVAMSDGRLRFGDRLLEINGILVSDTSPATLSAIIRDDLFRKNSFNALTLVVHRSVCYLDTLLSVHAQTRPSASPITEKFSLDYNRRPVEQHSLGSEFYHEILEIEMDLAHYSLGFRIEESHSKDGIRRIFIVDTDPKCPNVKHLKKGDRLLGVDGKSVTFMTFREVVNELQQLKGSGHLTVSRFRVYEGDHDNESTSSDDSDILDEKVPRVNSSLSNIASASIQCPETIFRMTLEKANELGISIVGGSDTKLKGIFVCSINEDGPAAKYGGLRIEDQILAVDNVDLKDADHETALKALRDSGRFVNLTIARRDADSSLPQDRIKVVLKKKKYDLFGLSLSTKVNGEVFISALIPGGIAERCKKLNIGDTILEVNGYGMVGRSHKDVSAVLRQIRGKCRLIVGRRHSQVGFSRTLPRGFSPKHNSSADLQTTISKLKLLSSVDNLHKQQVKAYASKTIRHGFPSCYDVIHVSWSDTTQPHQVDRLQNYGLTVKLATVTHLKQTVKGLWVCRIQPGSAAHVNGALLVGDFIVSLNNRDIFTWLTSVSTPSGIESGVDFQNVINRGFSGLPIPKMSSRNLRFTILRLNSTLCPCRQVKDPRDSRFVSYYPQEVYLVKPLFLFPWKEKKAPIAKATEVDDFSSDYESRSLPLVAKEEVLKSTIPTSVTSQEEKVQSKVVAELYVAQEISLFKGTRGLGFTLSGGKGTIRGDLPLFVQSIRPGGAAAQSGQLRVGDQIWSINNQSTSSWTLYDAVRVLHEVPQDQAVILRVIRPQASSDVTSMDV